MSNYPVGATWEFVAPEGSGIVSGAIGRVWLDRRDDRLEVWRWSWCYADEKGGEGDWNPSRRSAVEECTTRFYGRCKVRFRRVEQQGEDSST